MDTEIRVRFAPSPTGSLHIGGARTAYFNWLFARQHHGRFVLRVDDTDKARSTEASYHQILDSLTWLGLDWDEGPDVGGEYGPYRQSKRTDIYLEQLHRLIEQKRVYPCFCTADELREEREQAQTEGRAPRYSGRCRNLSEEEANQRLAADEPHVYRLKIELSGETVVQDLIRGEVSFQNVEIDDFIVWKADGTPTYHLASCIDDALMRITHIVRAEEHLSNTPRHVALFAALGYKVPLFAHVPMILAPDRSKLSKRHGATSVSEYREQGILADALVNYLLLLGFSPGEESDILSREEALKRFRLDSVAKHAAVYDVKKLEWMNAQYFRAQSTDVVLADVWDTFVEAGFVEADECRPERLAWVRTIVQFVQMRSRNIENVLSDVRPYFESVDAYDEKGIQKQFQDEAVIDRLRRIADALERTAPFTSVHVERSFRGLIDQLAVKGGQLIHPSRLALTGMTVGPGLFDVMALLGRDCVVTRLRLAADRIESGQILSV